MIRTVVSLLLTVTLASILGACAVEVDERHCPYGWVPAHRDGYGRWIHGHCR
jgi:hypothetical protein